VHTKDGYYLTAFRIMNKDDKERGIKRPVVFMQHGVTDYAFGWIMHYPEMSPAFQLSRAGYDVWLGNQRGCKFSNKHDFYDSKTDKEYWDFSFFEIGEYDAPAFVDYVRAHTGVDKISWMGHSQGTT
jgi:lysosomal acid lipase/cholesteryl ester hydrolase